MKVLFILLINQKIKFIGGEKMTNYIEKNEKKKLKAKKIIFICLILLLITILIIGLFIIFTKNEIKRTLIDGLTLSGALFLSTSWFMYIYNIGLFSSVSHGFKRFITFLQKKEEQKDYFEYLQERKHVSNTIIITIFVFSLALFSVILLLYLI